MSKTVIFFAHPNFNKSRLNKALINTITRECPDVLIRDLYQLYGNSKFNEVLNVAEDQKIIEKAERIILQFPFQWYSATPLMKKWLDDVLSYGWAYRVDGKDESKIRGKKLFTCNTTQGSQSDYAPNGYNNYYVTEFITPFVQTAKFCKMEFAGAFFVQNAGKITDVELEQKAQEYIKFVKGE